MPKRPSRPSRRQWWKATSNDGPDLLAARIEASRSYLKDLDEIRVGIRGRIEAGRTVEQGLIDEWLNKIAAALRIKLAEILADEVPGLRQIWSLRKGVMRQVADAVFEAYKKSSVKVLKLKSPAGGLVDRVSINGRPKIQKLSVVDRASWVDEADKTLWTKLRIFSIQGKELDSTELRDDDLDVWCESGNCRSDYGGPIGLDSMTFWSRFDDEGRRRIRENAEYEIERLRDECRARMGKAIERIHPAKPKDSPKKFSPEMVSRIILAADPGLTMDDLAEKTGRSKRTLYYKFRSALEASGRLADGLSDRRRIQETGHDGGMRNLIGERGRTAPRRSKPLDDQDNSKPE